MAYIQTVVLSRKEMYAAKPGLKYTPKKLSKDAHKKFVSGQIFSLFIGYYNPFRKMNEVHTAILPEKTLKRFHALVKT